MLLMVEKGIRGGICHAIQSSVKEINKYMKNYHKNVISSYLEYLDANDLYGCGMSQKLPVNSFKWVKKLSKFDERFIKDYDENSNKGYILEVDVPFLPERNEIKKCNKFVCNIRDKENYVVHIRALKQALYHGLILQKKYIYNSI